MGKMKEMTLSHSYPIKNTKCLVICNSVIDYLPIKRPSTIPMRQ